MQGTGIRTGEYGGPLVLFDEQLENVVIISSLNNFMVSSMEFSESRIKLGLMGSVTEIPKGETLEFLVVYANTLRGAFTRYGDKITLFGPANFLRSPRTAPGAHTATRARTRPHAMPRVLQPMPTRNRCGSHGSRWASGRLPPLPRCGSP